MKLPGTSWLDMFTRLTTSGVSLLGNAIILDATSAAWNERDIFSPSKTTVLYEQRRSRFQWPILSSLLPNHSLKSVKKQRGLLNSHLYVYMFGSTHSMDKLGQLRTCVSCFILTENAYLVVCIKVLENKTLEQILPSHKFLRINLDLPLRGCRIFLNDTTPIVRKA